MVERTLWTRGGLAAADVAGGIPEGAVRHDPRAPSGPHLVPAIRGVRVSGKGITDTDEAKG